MKPFSLSKEIIVAEIPKVALQVCVYMGYLQYNTNEPVYENWIKDEDIEDPVKMQQYLDKVKPGSDYKIKPHAAKIPEGYILLSLHSEMTEELAKTIMPYNERNKMYKAFGNGSCGYWFKSSLESYQSWMKSLYGEQVVELVILIKER